jgi:hypothetical protein
MKKSRVVFDEAAHSYTLNGELLPIQGITRMIDRQIFGGKMQNVPESVLKKYAEFGSLVHKEIQDYYENGDLPTTDEAMAFVTKGIQCLTCEYVVGDDRVATAIDFVGEDFFLYDFKTSTTLDKERLSWQLSICAYLFEKQTGMKVKGLMGVHLRGKECTFVGIERKHSEQVEALIRAELTGESYLSEERSMQRLIDLERTIIQIKQEAEMYEERKKVLLAGLQEKMAEMGLKTLKTENLILTLVPESSTTTLDAKKLKEEMPEIYKQFERSGTRKGYLKMTVK